MQKKKGPSWVERLQKNQKGKKGGSDETPKKEQKSNSQQSNSGSKTPQPQEQKSSLIKSQKELLQDRINRKTNEDEKSRRSKIEKG